MSYIYFNVALLRISKKPINVDKESINPNLSKIFLRHYTDFAKTNNYSIESDDEDYVIPSQNKHKTSEEISLKDLQQNSRPMPVKPPPPKKPVDIKHTGKKTDIFAADEKQVGQLKESDFKNKFEFPSLNGEAAPKVNSAPVATWGPSEAYLYNKKGALSKKEMEEAFPSLGAVVSQPKKAAVAPTITPVVTSAPPKPEISAPLPPGQFNWLEEIKKNASSIQDDGIFIQRAKKKKK